jgi:release factor glutamine methyltransferase
VYEGDLFDPLPENLRGRVAVLTANVPYVPAGEIGLLPAEARAHEPLTALDGGPDGLDVLRRVAREAPDWLAAGGYLLTEASERQVPAAVEVLSGLAVRVTRSAELDAVTIIGSS